MSFKDTRDAFVLYHDNILDPSSLQIYAEYVCKSNRMVVVMKPGNEQVSVEVRCV